MNDMTVNAVIAIWVLISAGMGYYATTRGRTAAKWFFISLFLSPVIAFALLNKNDDLPRAMK